MEGLEELEKIKKFQFTYPILRIGKEKRETTTVGKIFENELSIIEKELKALEIIKELRCFTFYEIDNRYYISGIGMPKEIYDLLKEVLK